ncbi:hypothetical protein C8J57DRAFT_1435286 [Mycena rebaudengoi]|nr:hypothetical protein C8J57DRAFT_1435286 [Mycena rebaudengoi]
MFPAYLLIPLSSSLTGVFTNWAPCLFDYYVKHMRPFYAGNPHLCHPFLNGIWSACTFNMGPKTCALGHRDFANLAFGWCSIMALGYFNYTKGRHLILWDCKLVIDAAIFHSNIPIAAKGETWYLFTQYTAGGLFCWVQHGFQLEEEYFDSLTPEEAKWERAEGQERWRMGAGLFSMMEELQSTS